METEKITWSEFPNGGKAIAFAEQILMSELRKKSKQAGLWESQSGIRVAKLTIWVRSFEITEPLWWTIKSAKINTLDGLIMRTLCMLDEMESQTMDKDKEGDQYRKKKWVTEWSKASQKHKRIHRVF